MNTRIRNQNERADRNAGIVVGLAALAVAAAIFIFPACSPTTGDQPRVDWHKVDVAGDEILLLLDQQAIVWDHRPDVVHTIEEIEKVVRDVDAAVSLISEGGSIGDFDEALDAAILLVDQLSIEAGDDDDMLAILSSVRALLGAMRIMAA